MFVRSAVHAAALCVVVSASAAAQDSSSCGACRQRVDRTPSEFALRSSGTVAVAQSRPVGPLQKNIGFGYGLNGAYLLRLDHAGFWSLRADLGLTQYGNESKRVPLSPSIGGRIQVDVSTDNYIVPMSIGPQLTWPRGKIRPYVNAGIGGEAFFTESHVNGSDDSGNFARTTNQSDFSNSWVAGGGLYLPLYERKTKIALDIGVQYYSGGQARYLRPGSIVDLDDSQLQITPMQSTTRLVLVRMGVKIGL